MTPVPETVATALTPQAQAEDRSPGLPRRILVALDASDHANHALTEAIRLAAATQGEITGIHAYAAKLHDRRFRQMEGGLPDRYRTEDRIEHQRTVHDSLITRGLAIISDSYHDAAGSSCKAGGVPYHRLSPEGKNYRRIVEAVGAGNFDLVALGSRGLGAVPGGGVGTVCERVARRCPIDLLMIRDPGRSIGEGPLVSAIDGSASPPLTQTCISCCGVRMTASGRASSSTRSGSVSRCSVVAPAGARAASSASVPWCSTSTPSR